MQRALQAQQEAELAEAARKLHALEYGSANGLDVPFARRTGLSGPANGARVPRGQAMGRSSSGSDSSAEASAATTGTHTPLARSNPQQSFLSSARPIPGSTSTSSFADTRNDGFHNPAPGTIHLSPGPSNMRQQPMSSNTKYELGSSYVDGLSASPFTNGTPYSEVLGGLASFMSLNAPASPKRLSALEMTFPSLEALGYSSEEEGTDRDPGPYAVSSRGRTFRRTSSASQYRQTSRASSASTDTMSPNRAEARRSKKPRARLSSFHEYGDRPAPTSLAILAGLISGSARIIDRAYMEQGIPVPDIDDPGLPKSKYAKEQTELKVTNEIYRAIEVCIEACHQLVGIVQRPEVTCAEAAYAFELSAALKVTVEAHVVEVLREEGQKGMHIKQLAERVGMEPSYLLRIMRLLVSHNIFLEMGHGTSWFANNRVSLRIDSKEALAKVLADEPMEPPDGPRVEIRSLVSHATDYTWNSASQMEDRLRGETITQIEPQSEEEAAARLYRQLNARKCSSYLGDPPNLVNVLKQLGNGLVCDLGSGLGRDLLGVARAYPHLRIELHDKPATMALARDMWYRQSPRSVITKAVTFHPHDLLGPVKYSRASTYLIRNHLVHWSDADVLQILTRARAAAFKSSRLFVEESTSDDELPSDLSFLRPDIREVVEPVIAETSHNADRIQHLLDVSALLSGSGRKRTIIELVLLLDSAGWRTEKIDNTSGGRCKIFECRPIFRNVDDE